MDRVGLIIATLYMIICVNEIKLNKNKARYMHSSSLNSTLYMFAHGNVDGS